MKNEFDYLNDAKIDFSKYEETILSEKELEKMKDIIKTAPKGKKPIWGRVAALAACVAVVAAFSQTAIAKELFDGIIKKLSTGRNEFYQYDVENMEVDIPEEYQILFDENGNLVTKYNAGTVYYDKDGNKIDDPKAYMAEAGIYDAVVTEKDGVYTITVANEEDNILEYMRKKGYNVIDNEKDIVKLNEALDFDCQLPSKLPEGFSFMGAGYFEDDGKYLFLYYSDQDGRYISVDQRLITDETAITMGTDEEIEETEVNGHKAVLSGERNLDWEYGDVAIGIHGRDLITRDQLFDMAESME